MKYLYTYGILLLEEIVCCPLNVSGKQIRKCIAKNTNIET